MSLPPTTGPLQYNVNTSEFQAHLPTTTFACLPTQIYKVEPTFEMTNEGFILDFTHMLYENWDTYVDYLGMCEMNSAPEEIGGQ